jgi:hypothetical protein
MLHKSTNLLGLKGLKIYTAETRFTFCATIVVGQSVLLPLAILTLIFDSPYIIVSTGPCTGVL